MFLAGRTTSGSCVAVRLLDKEYRLDFNPRHCTVTRGQQQAHLIRHSRLCSYEQKRSKDNGKSFEAIQPAEETRQQQDQTAPLTHTDQRLRRIHGGNTGYWKLDGDYAIRVHKQPRKTLFTSHNSCCPVPTEQLDDCRLTIVDRQGQEQEQLQENTKHPSNQELQRRLEGSGVARF